MSVAFCRRISSEEFPACSVSLVQCILARSFFLLVAYQWYFPDVHGLRYVNLAVHIFFIYIAYLLWNSLINEWNEWINGPTGPTME